MVIADLKKSTEQKMDKSVQAFKGDLAKVRTGRAHTGILDHVTVDYYGSQMPLNQVAKVTLIDSRTIGVTPFEKKMTQAVEKAIRDSDLGLNPSNDGNMIRLGIPPLTEERRREMVKVVRHIAEEGRVKIRNVRRDVMHDLRELREGGDAGEDEERRAESELQKVTDAKIADLDNHLKGKEAEILEV
jgi:ribosome recycling factor